MNIYPYVYRLDHPTTGEFYIGYRAANKTSAYQDLGYKYFTSSRLVKPRFHEFDCKILAEFFDKNAAYDFEQQLISECFNDSLCLNSSCYMNKRRFKIINHTEESKHKISESRKGIKFSEEHKANLKLASRNRDKSFITDEYKEKLANAARDISEETRAKRKASLSGKIKSEEHLRKISEALKGKSRKKGMITCYDKEQDKWVSIPVNEFRLFKNVRYLNCMTYHKLFNSPSS